jgi:acyl-homoserine-lactone acylase
MAVGHEGGRMSKLSGWALCFICALTAACSSAPESEQQAAQAPKRYNATVRWTSYGVPHIKAQDWGGLGYGFAYAVATDGVCILAREFVVVRGEQSKYFGPEEGRREADIFHKAIITDAALAKAAERAPEEMRALQAGYIAGYNRYLAEHPGDKLPASCRNQPWVRPIDAADIARMTIGVGIRYGVGRAQAAIAQAAPPNVEVKTGWTELPAEPLAADEAMFGSNAIALGKLATTNGRGMLLGNPHYPWSGPSRFHMAHLTIPGELDLMGVGLFTTQFVSIGFNHDVAWTHTVSTGLRYTLYELELDPADPLAYRYGGEMKRMQPRRVTIEARTADGAVATEAHTIYESHLGPMIEDKDLPWTRERAYAIRDSNLDNNRSSEQYLKFGRAKSVEELLRAMQETQGVAWVNTIAADRHGKALYADLSVVPNVDEALIKRCASASVQRWREAPTVVLKATPDCEWRNDARAQQPGILPPQELPSLIREDYVTNSNDSYWLANPAQPLEGYSPIIGPERTARTLRTRAGLVMTNEVLQARERNKFDPERLQALLFNQRNYGAELALDDVLRVCATPEAAAARSACEALASWDRKQTIESRGAQVWTEFWPLVEKAPNLWRTPFDVKDPVHTPRDVNVGDSGVRAAIVQALAAAAKKLSEAQIPLDAPWGQVQFAERGGDKIPIPGGLGNTGMFSMIVSKLTPGKGYTPIITGNSWIQVVTWDEQGAVDARGLLTYSQSEEADSPHAADQTRLYARGEWLRLPFSEREIASDPHVRSVQLSGDE